MSEKHLVEVLRPIEQCKLQGQYAFLRPGDVVDASEWRVAGINSMKRQKRIMDADPKSKETPVKEILDRDETVALQAKMDARNERNENRLAEGAMRKRVKDADIAKQRREKAASLGVQPY